MYLTNVTGKSYVAEHDTFNGRGVNTDIVRSHADGSLDYSYHLDTTTGVKTVDIFDAAGRLKTDLVTRADGTTDLKTYAGDGRTLVSEAIKFAQGPGQTELSDTFQYSNGILVSETQVHADKSKDVYLTNVTGKSYVAEHDTIDSRGVTTDIVRTHADKSLDYSYHLDTTTGVKTADTYDAAGRLKTDLVTRADGTTDLKTYAGDGRTLVSEAIKFAQGPVRRNCRTRSSTATGRSSKRRRSMPTSRRTCSTSTSPAKITSPITISTQRTASWRRPT